MTRLAIAPLALWSATANAEDGGAEIHPVAQLQVWATVIDQDVSDVADPATYGDPEVDPGFQLYRARAGAAGAFDGPDGIGESNAVDFKVWFGVSPAYDVPQASLLGDVSTVGLVDAWLRWSVRTGLGDTEVAAGVMTVPFNRERLISSTDLLFQERSVGGEWTTAARDTGAVAAQSFELGDGALVPRIKVAVGVYNGEPDAILGNALPGLMEVGRVEFELGDAYRTWDPEGDPAFGAGFAARNETDPATDTFTWTGDLLVRAWYVCLLAEFSQQSIALGDTTVLAPGINADTERRGAMGQLSFFVPIRDDRGVEIGGRYALFDDDVSTVSTGDVSIVHAGATWRSALPGLDLGAGYIHRAEPAEVGAFANDSVRLWTQVALR
ncbi:MAG: hypothetical protein H0V89_10815 [Deltaproteobacteria bacterium]|nr:hypothetical protein [Deltaproteobacteria bacterium]